jgi:hypothetical protein
MAPAPEILSLSSGGRQISIEHFKAPHLVSQAAAVLLLHGADGLKGGRHYHLAAQIVAAAGYHAYCTTWTRSKAN